MANIRVIQSKSFGKAVKKLKANQKVDLDEAVKHLMENPLAGTQKKGDLAHLRSAYIQAYTPSSQITYIKVHSQLYGN